MDLKMKPLLFLTLVCAALFSACAAPAATTNTTSSTTGKIGTPVQTDGGTYTNISAAELKTMLAAKDFAFINTHIPYAGEIANTDAFVPYDSLNENLGKLPSDKNVKIVLYCRSDRMSNIAAQELVKKGYTNLYNLVGGMDAWEQAGYPLIHNPS
jgi:rhodanese-related sulfurtransferase